MIPPVPSHPQTPRAVYYSIGVSPTGSLKERIAELHGCDSPAARVVAEIDQFLSTPAFRQARWYRAFYRKVLTAMSILYDHAHRAAHLQMAEEYIDDLVHGGYLRVLQALAVPSGRTHVSFAQEFAQSYGVPLSEVLLFGPRGGAVQELLHFVAAEKAHGIHRPRLYRDGRVSERTQECEHHVQNTRNWPTAVNVEGEEVPFDPSEDRSPLSEEAMDRLQTLWRRNPALRKYTGSQRLGGDTSYQIVEDAVDVLIRNDSSPLSQTQIARYTEIVATANREGIDPFYAAYQALPASVLARCWDLTRQWLHDYSLTLWETQNQLWLAEGKRVPAGGVVCRPAKAAVPEPKKAVPGTLYLNNGRYWWVVKNKMKARPLIDPQSKKKVPGTIFQDDGRYYWVIAGVLGRQRLVPKGEKFSTDDRATAERVASQKWQQLRKENPSLAARILSRRRAQGLATKDRALADKIAARLWKQIQRDDPELAAQIQQSRRRQAQDHWYAHLGAGATQRHIGSYASKAEAQAAYAREFEQTYGYPPGYNVQCLPKLDKVWPSWSEETARLACRVERPRMPVVYPAEGTEPLAPLLQKMQKVSWLVGHVLVVFDGQSPVAAPDIAIQSRGRAWYEQAHGQGQHLVVYGCACVDPDTRRIRITLYKPGFGARQVLLEEIYHIGLKILFYESPRLFAAVGRWHREQLARGEDPTFSLADRFAWMMAQEETGVRTSLPARVVASAQKLLSPTSHVPISVMQHLIGHWSQPLPA